MEEKLKIEDFDEEIQKEDYEAAYNKIVKKSIELSQKIAQLKQIDIPDEPIEDTLYTIQFMFKKSFGKFREGIYLMKNLIEWDCEDYEFLPETPKEKIEKYIRGYNCLIFDLNQYIETKKEISENGYEKLLEERKEKLRKLYIEMLEYKNKKYDENDSFRDLTRKVSHYYNIYSQDLYNAEFAMGCHAVEFDVEEPAVEVDDVEVIMLLDELYEYLTFEGDSYKENADYYKDFELEEGQTYSDLYDLEIEKFIKLFKEMLDFVNVPYNKSSKDFEDLKFLVMKHYPYYQRSLFYLIPHNPNLTYIQILDGMEMGYENISENYRNHEENMKKYNEELKRYEAGEEMDFFRINFDEDIEDEINED